MTLQTIQIILKDINLNNVQNNGAQTDVSNRKKIKIHPIHYFTKEDVFIKKLIQLSLDIDEISNTTGWPKSYELVCSLCNF